MNFFFEFGLFLKKNHCICNGKFPKFWKSVKVCTTKKVGRHRDISIDNFIIHKCIWHPICKQQHNLLPVYRISTDCNAQWLMRQKSVQFVAQIMWEYGIRDSVHNILCCSCTVRSIHSSVLMRHKLFKKCRI